MSLTPAQQALVRAEIGLVDASVRRMRRRFPQLEAEELRSVGHEALTTASATFDPGRGVPFGAYAQRHVVGRMLDHAGKTWRDARRLSFIDQAGFDHLDGFEDDWTRPKDAVAAELVGLVDRMALSHIAHETDVTDHVALGQAVDRLPARDRALVGIVFLEQRSVRDAAVELEISYRTAWRRLSDLITVLRRTLAVED